MRGRRSPKKTRGRARRSQAEARTGLESPGRRRRPVPEELARPRSALRRRSWRRYANDRPCDPRARAAEDHPPRATGGETMQSSVAGLGLYAPADRVVANVRRSAAIRAREIEEAALHRWRTPGAIGTIQRAARTPACASLSGDGASRPRVADQDPDRYGLVIRREARSVCRNEAVELRGGSGLSRVQPDGSSWG